MKKAMSVLTGLCLSVMLLGACTPNDRDNRDDYPPAENKNGMDDNDRYDYNGKDDDLLEDDERKEQNGEEIIEDPEDAIDNDRNDE